MAVAAKADGFTKLDTSGTDVLYIDGTVQAGSTGNLYLKMKNSQYIGTITCVFKLPDGFTLDEATVSKNVLSLGKVDGYYKLSYKKGWEASTDPVTIVTLPVTVTANAGRYAINATSYQMVHTDLTTVENENVYTSVTVKRAAILHDMPANYSIEIIPCSVTTETTSFALNLKNEEAVSDISFDIEFPEGIVPVSTINSRGITVYTAPTINKDRLELSELQTKAPSLTEDNTYSYGLVNTSEIDVYKANGSGLAMTIPVTCSTIADGIYTIKIKNIVVKSTTNYRDFTTHEGEYWCSVFVGTPTETDPIVYGHYTTEGLAALKAVSTNFVSVDMSAATIGDVAATTIDEEKTAESNVAKELPSIMVYGPDCATYYRKSAATGRYGTICVPFVLTSKDQSLLYYSLSKVDGNELTFTQASSIPSDVPALYLTSGNDMTAQSEAYDYNYATSAYIQDKVGDLTFTGTYSNLTINDGEGYYISSNQFYNKGPKGVGHFTIAPYHAYLAGSIESSNNAKGLTILIDDETGIHDVTDQISEETMNAIYDLQGIKLNTVRKGAVNIIDGKKVLVK